MAKAQAYGRVGLLGNPSDIYGGKCISFTFNKYAEAEIKECRCLRIFGNDGKEENNLEYKGADDKHKLVKATIKRLGLEKKCFEIIYDSEVPFGSGLAGSSAIIIAATRAFNEFYNLGLDKYEVAEFSLRVETEELGIAAGFQDRYAISFGGVTYMDFSGKEYMREDDSYGKVEQFDIFDIPFFLSLGVKPKGSSSGVHNSLRKRFLMGGNDAVQIKNEMDRIAGLAEEGKEYLLCRDWNNFGALMWENTCLRERLCPHLPMDLKMINSAMKLGALGAKVAGSGGAIVILSEDEKVFNEMSKNYPCFRPNVV